MSERELLNLIFLPGFSTAEKVTQRLRPRRRHGRGARPTSRRSAARSTSQSRPGSGTTLKIKIPLTLAIIPALIVTSGGDRYAIPQVSLLELVRLEGEQARRGIEHDPRRAGLPAARQPAAAGLPRPRAAASSRPRDAERRAVNIVVLQADDRQFGLVVDEHQRHRGDRRQAAAASSSRASASSPARRSWATARWR